MDLRKFEYLVTISETRTLSAAAQKLYISQPSLSQFLQKTESELGFKLFKRVNNELLPTAAGTIFLKSAYEILHIYHTTISDLMDYTENDSGELSIGMTLERGSISLHEIYFHFHEQFPHAKLLCYEDTPQILEEKTISGQLDISIASKYRARRELDYIPLCSNTMLVCINKNHPAIQTLPNEEDGIIPFIDLSLLKDCEFIHNKRSTKTRYIVEDIFTENRIIPSVAFETSSVRTSINMASVSNIIALVPSAYLLPNNHVRYFRIQNSPVWDICASIKKGRKLNKFMSHFIYITRQHLNETILVKN